MIKFHFEAVVVACIFAIRIKENEVSSFDDKALK